MLNISAVFVFDAPGIQVHSFLWQKKMPHIWVATQDLLLYIFRDVSAFSDNKKTLYEFDGAYLVLPKDL